MQPQEVEALLSRANSLLGVGPKSSRRAEYLQITEGREDWGPAGAKKHYGWCGDFVTYCIMQQGSLDGELLNRAELNGKWVPGDNITRITRVSKARGWVKPKDAPVERGDIVVLARQNGDHIGFAVSGGYQHYTTIDGNGWGGVVVLTNRDVRPIALIPLSAIPINLSPNNPGGSWFPIPGLPIPGTGQGFPFPGLPEIPGFPGLPEPPGIGLPGIPGIGLPGAGTPQLPFPMPSRIPGVPAPKMPGLLDILGPLMQGKITGPGVPELLTALLKGGFQDTEGLPLPLRVANALGLPNGDESWLLYARPEGDSGMLPPGGALCLTLS